MTIINDFWWAVALSGASIAVWIIFVVFIPNCLCSLFRYRLWRLRDAVKDDILYGRLPDRPFIREFVSMLESYILVANKLTLVQLLLLPSNKQEAERRIKELMQSIHELSEEPRKRILAYQEDLKLILVTRLFIGSVTGWIFLTFLMPAIIMMFIYRVIQRASVSATDLIVSVVGCIYKAMRKDVDWDWQDDVTGKILTMRMASDPSETLSNCAA